MKRAFLITFLTISFLSGVAFASPSLEEVGREHLLEKISGEWVSHGIYAATALEIPDHLDNGPLHYIELAKLSQTDPNSLYRLLRMLSSQGIFFEHEDRSFSHSEASKLLSKQHPNSLHSLTTFYGSVIHNSWEGLVGALQEGSPGFEKEFGLPVFLYFKQHPEVFHLFHAAMKEKSNNVIDSCLENFNFGAYQTVFDIGGGKGHLLSRILKTYEHMKGGLFDLPEVIEKVQHEITKYSDRTSLIPGNFLQEIPKGADLYILKSVIHDWSDPEAITILMHCYEAMPEDGSLLIIEPILAERNAPDYAKQMDILMLNVTGGKERSFEEFANLLRETHFEIEKVYPTSTEFKMILATKR